MNTLLIILVVFIVGIPLFWFYRRSEKFKKSVETTYHLAEMSWMIVGGVILLGIIIYKIFI